MHVVCAIHKRKNIFSLFRIEVNIVQKEKSMFAFVCLKLIPKQDLDLKMDAPPIANKYGDPQGAGFKRFQQTFINPAR